MTGLKVCGQRFIDSKGRSVLLRGINLSGDSKLPRTPDVPSHNSNDFWNTNHISFVGRPFDLADADQHLGRIVSWGYNVVRFVITWEAIEHAGPGLYDQNYVSYVLEVLKKCGEHKLYVIMDPHQDVWSRFSGGSGAPYWTFLAIGMDPKFFDITEGAIVHNTSGLGEAFPKMIWSTNYDKMAAATMFILFFAGRHFAPKAILNGQNIQDYLQTHFIGSMTYLAQRIHDEGNLEGSIVIGWESMNEPSMSWIGCKDLNVIPERQRLRKGHCPTPFQALCTASGLSQQVEIWDFKMTGPRKIGSHLVDPKGKSIWFDTPDYDIAYQWTRNKSWVLGTCIWEQHGVWTRHNKLLLKPDYFSRGPDNELLDDAGYLSHFWMHHFRSYKEALRAVFSRAIVFCQPPVMMIPPVFNEIDRKDSQIVYSPHFYDGLTLINKTWNTWYNVDVLGVLRGRYLSPVFAVKFGLRAIRNSLKAQITAIRDEGLMNLGEYPCLFSEIGIPFDMDGKEAYNTGDYSSQIGALDANCFALEGAMVHFTFWHYSVVNTHTFGDFWNGEDLSFSTRSETSVKDEAMSKQPQANVPARPRAAVAVLRPAPIKSDLLGIHDLPTYSCRICGSIESYHFDSRSRRFTIAIRRTTINTTIDHPSLFYLPLYHFSDPEIEVSEGTISWDAQAQSLSWWHDSASTDLFSKLIVSEKRSH